MVYKRAIQLDLLYDKAWGKYAKENNIENPFKRL